jgi:hypothetical protein
MRRWGKAEVSQVNDPGGAARLAERIWLRARRRRSILE